MKRAICRRKQQQHKKCFIRFRFFLSFSPLNISYLCACVRARVRVCVCVREWETLCMFFGDLNVPAIYYIGLRTFKRFSIKKVSHNSSLSLSLLFFAALKNKYCSCSQIVDTDITTYPIDIRTAIKKTECEEISSIKICSQNWNFFF